MLRSVHSCFISLCVSIWQTSTVAAGVTTRPCPTLNKTEIVYRGAGAKLDDIYNELLSCPNITSLHLDFVWSGCVAPEDPWFDFRPADRFPPLKKLSLCVFTLCVLRYLIKSSLAWHHIWTKYTNIGTSTNYHLGVPRAPWTRRTGIRDILTGLYDAKQSFLEYLGLIDDYSPLDAYRVVDDWLERRSDVPWEGVNLAKWRQAMDFSQIEELHLGQEGKVFYEQMKHELPSLKHLSCDWRNSGPHPPPERINFIRSVPPLESLSITIGVPYYYDKEFKSRTQFPLNDILEIHGRSLQRLSLQQREGREPDLRRPMLSLDDFNSIHKACPNLDHLCVDIDRNETHGWPNQTFDAITNIASLKSLTLRLEIGADLHDHDPGEYYWNGQGLNGSGPFREPRMSLEVAEQLFRGLQSRKQGESLNRVDFVVGDFENKPYSGPLYFPNWDEGRERMFTCETVSSNDGQVKPSCQMLGGEDPWDDNILLTEGFRAYD